MDELFLRLRFLKRAQRVAWTNSSIIPCPKSGHEPFNVGIYITMTGQSIRCGCSFKLKESQGSMEHLTQDDRRDMVQYGRPLKEEGAMLGVLTAELI